MDAPRTVAVPINERQAITNLQRYLRRLSFEYEGEVEDRLPVDGIFDSSTADALKKFQSFAGLDPTGVADKQTWDALFSEYRRVTENERQLRGLFIFPQSPSDYAVSLGDTLTLVRIIQLLLLELRATYDVFEDVVESGTYDAKTQKAIEDLGIEWSVISDVQGKTLDLYGISGIPYLILFAPDGTIVSRGARGEGLKAVVDAAMSEK